MSSEGRAFVTGAAGYIGSELCRILDQDGWKITGLIRKSRGPHCHRVVSGDIADVASWQEALSEHEVVFHLAGKVHALTEYKQQEREYFKLNTEATGQILAAAAKRGVRRFVYFSSVKAVGTTGAHAARTPSTEEDKTPPDTTYGESKLRAEHIVLEEQSSIERVVLRPCMVYGAGTKGNITAMLGAVMRNTFPPLPYVSNKRSMVHVNDVARAASVVATHPLANGQIFNLSDGVVYSSAELYDLMRQALGRGRPRIRVPAAVLRVSAAIGDGIEKIVRRRVMFDTDKLNQLLGDAWFSSEKISARVGFTPARTLAGALPEMIRALRDQRR